MAGSTDTGGHAGAGRANRLVRVEILRRRLASLLAEWEDLRTQVIPHLAAEYVAKIGVWKQREAAEELLARRARRKTSLLRAQISQGKLVGETECERILDVEFQQWKKQMAQWAQRIRMALAYRASAIPLSSKDSAEFRRLFRTLARRLHPDLHPLDEERSRYYEMACSYYEQGDIEGLRAVEAATAHLRDDTNLENLSDEELDDL